MLKSRNNQLAIADSNSTSSLLAAVQQFSAASSFSNATAQFEHLNLVRDAHMRLTAIAHDTDVQAARFLIREPFHGQAACVRSLLQLYYPLTDKLLLANAALLDKNLIGQNVNLATTDLSVIEDDFELNWTEISRFRPLTPAQLKRFADKIDWDEAALNPLIDWTLSLIKIHQHRSKKFFTKLSANPGLQWSADLILSLDSKWDCTEDGLLNNDGLPWDEHKEVNRFEDISNCSYQQEIRDACVLMKSRVWERTSANRHIEWSAEYLRENADELNWALVSANPGIPFSFELLGEFADQWDWEELGTNHGVYKHVLLPWLSDTVVQTLLTLDA